MGKRGPKPKPTALRLLEGNPGHKPINESEPKPERAAWLEAPEWLGDHGRAKWFALVPHLGAVGLFTVLDADALAMYCEAWDEFFAARAEIEASGIVACAGSGAEYQHPAVGIKNKAIQRIRQFAQDFGMTPAARQGLNAAPGGQQDDLDAYKRSA